MTSMLLISNGTASSSGAIKTPFAGTYMCRVNATFNGSTIKLQILSSDGSTWLDLPNASVTAAAVFYVQLPQEARIKALVSGGPPAGAHVTLDYVGD